MPFVPPTPVQRRGRRVAAIAAAALVLICAGVGSLSAQSSATLDSIVRPLMHRYDVPGVALAIVRGDSVVALRGYGVARVRDSVPVDPARTLFRLASVSKLFVATAVMQQVERGAVDLRADVNRYLARRVPDTWPEPVTLDALLTHTAGFDERLIGYASPSREAVGALGASLAANLPYRGWRPGDVMSYSNYGVALAAHVVERTSGESFDRYARARIFEPLGMTRTWYLDVPPEARADVADGHFCDHTGCDPAPVVWSHPYPVGLAWSTAADMAQFLIAQLNGGATHAGRALQPASVATMQAQHFTGDAMLPGISYVFFNQRARGHAVLAHAGNVPGTNNLLLIVPDARLGIYFVANGGRSAFGAALRDSLLARLLPDASSPPGPTIALGDDWLRRLAGPYQLARYAHRTIERFPLLFATSVPVFADSGRIVIPYPNGALAFAPVDSFHFREVGGERLIAFERDASGRIVRLVAPVPVFGAELPGVLERRAWHDGAHFMNEYISWLVLVPLILLAVPWPVCAWIAWRRRRAGGAAGAPTRAPRLVLDCAWLFALVWPAFAFGFIATSVRMFERATGLVYGVPAWMRVAGQAPWALALLAVVISAGAIASWRGGWWDPVRRAALSGVAVTAILTIAFLIRWNYLPVVF